MKRVVQSLGFLACATILALSCSATEPTQIVVIVEVTSSKVKQVEFQAQRDGDTREQPPIATVGTRPLWYSLLHTSGGREIKITVRGKDGGQVILTRSATVEFVPGQIKYLRMDLYEECITASCGAGLTCTESGCIPDAEAGRKLTDDPGVRPIFTGMLSWAVPAARRSFPRAARVVRLSPAAPVVRLSPAAPVVRCHRRHGRHDGHRRHGRHDGHRRHRWHDGHRRHGRHDGHRRHRWHDGHRRHRWLRDGMGHRSGRLQHQRARQPIVHADSGSTNPLYQDYLNETVATQPTLVPEFGGQPDRGFPWISVPEAYPKIKVTITSSGLSFDAPFPPDAPTRFETNQPPCRAAWDVQDLRGPGLRAVQRRVPLLNGVVPTRHGKQSTSERNHGRRHVGHCLAPHVDSQSRN